MNTLSISDVDEFTIEVDAPQDLAKPLIYVTIYHFVGSKSLRVQLTLDQVDQLCINLLEAKKHI